MRLFPAVLVVMLAACSTPQPAPTHSPAPVSPGATFAPTSSVATPSPSYLGAKELDILAIVSPAPAEGSIRYETDRRIFLATRAFAGSPRWQMAADDAQLGSTSLLKHFACALNVVLDPATVPQTLRLLQRSVRDAGVAMNTVKDHYKRLRPYRIDTGPLCRAVDDLGDTYDYPSGHAMAGWTWAMSLTQLAPDRTAPLLARGRAIGDSRVVCGVHNASAVDAARVAATAVMAALYANPEWQADARAARGELATVRATAPRPDPKMCADEAALIAIPIG